VLDVPIWARRWILLANPEGRQHQGEQRGFVRSRVADTRLPGKTSKLQVMQSVPETDTGGRGEYPQAFETTRMKELGKIVP
jgi:hypothetical protein